MSVAGARRPRCARRRAGGVVAARGRVRREPLFPRRGRSRVSTTSAPSRVRAHRHGDLPASIATTGRSTRRWRLPTRSIVDRYLEVKAVGIEVLARYRRRLHAARCCRAWKRWLANGHSSNWATTDAICGSLIGPLLAGASRARRPSAPLVASSQHVGASRVGRELDSVGRAQGLALDAAYDVARRLHADREDLIQKAVGWMLREAGKADPARLERYLRPNGPRIPRTTLRYAIERFPPAKRAAANCSKRRRRLDAEAFR